MGDKSDSKFDMAAEESVSYKKALQLVSGSSAKSSLVDLKELRNELNEELWHNVGPGNELDLKKRRFDAQDWALQALKNLASETPLQLPSLQVILTTLMISSSDDREAVEKIQPEVIDFQVAESLLGLLRRTKLNAGSQYGRGGDQHWHEEIQAAIRNDDYRTLGLRIRYLDFRLTPDLRLSIMLLAKFFPEKLSSYIKERRDVFFSISVRDVLRESAIQFSLDVDDVVFKFVCLVPLASVRLEDVAEGTLEAFCGSLLQISATDSWHAWMYFFAQHPQADSIAVKAISVVLVKLTAAHWADFVRAVELWTHAATAVVVAQILVPFFEELGCEKSLDMWKLSFVRWNEWDYGRDDERAHLFAPAECSFDFPVAMYYAFLPFDEVLSEEARLERDIATIEQRWFPDFSELVTVRNRLSSRLRLVRHGIVIRDSSAGSANPLPPNIEPDGEFSAVRYHFSDRNWSGRR